MRGWCRRGCGEIVHPRLHRALLGGPSTSPLDATMMRLCLRSSSYFGMLRRVGVVDRDA